MVFIGNGSYLRNAISTAYNKGYSIDYVFSENSELENYLSKLEVPFRVVDVNSSDTINIIKEQCYDKIVFSINNGQILKQELLSLKDFKFYNIHNGIIPAYRGRPEICIIYAILNNEKEYGVSLHEIDQGIDTGPCISIRKFEISLKDTFQSVILKSIEECNRLFEETLESIMKGNHGYCSVIKQSSKLYSYKDLERLIDFKGHPDFRRATNFGVFSLWYKKAYSYIKNEIG